MALTPECLISEGSTFTGKDCQSRRFIERMNAVTTAFCDIDRRIKIAEGKLSQYCEIPSPSASESSSSSSSECRLGCEPVQIPQYLFMLNVNMLGQAEYDALKVLEEEVCAAYRDLKLLENEVSVGCASSSSFQPSSSSSGPPPPSSSSSSAPPSSSSSAPPSSSSSLPATCYLENLSIASFCEEMSYLNGIALAFDTYGVHPGYGECYYRESPYIPPLPVSSSSSSVSSSSSGLSNEIFLRFNLAGVWELGSDELGILAIRTSSNEHDPRGEYQYLQEACLGQSITIS